MASNYIIDVNKVSNLKRVGKDFVLEFEVRFGQNLPASNESLWLAYHLISGFEDQGSVALFHPKNPSGAAVPLGAHTAANGIAITHEFGSPNIVLAANQTYQATFSGTVRVANGGAIINFKLNGSQIGFPSSFSGHTNGSNLSFSNTVIFSTTRESVLTINNINVVAQTFGTLNISVVRLA
ncbi:hypothetical protein OIN60_20545 [Paenibacillus sp. P96]|uniref:BclA C-terminal domain-containing protein n=1 Tax=Paenibacillus zeirhizosphaerae TaxID=2987519 RepID=A0ABT9FWV2_9BACL|nr:hypothetical protein [Paenibacillus sp. P96]MDP4099114.1 hypothetical protein [Paenibacillus sp. P96]